MLLNSMQHVNLSAEFIRNRIKVALSVFISADFIVSSFHLHFENLGLGFNIGILTLDNRVQLRGEMLTI